MWRQRPCGWSRGCDWSCGSLWRLKAQHLPRSLDNLRNELLRWHIGKLTAKEGADRSDPVHVRRKVRGRGIEAFHRPSHCAALFHHSRNNLWQEFANRCHAILDSHQVDVGCEIWKHFRRIVLQRRRSFLAQCKRTLCESLDRVSAPSCIVLLGLSGGGRLGRNCRLSWRCGRRCRGWSWSSLRCCHCRRSYSRCRRGRCRRLSRCSCWSSRRYRRWFRARSRGRLNARRWLNRLTACIVIFAGAGGLPRPLLGEIRASFQKIKATQTVVDRVTVGIGIESRLNSRIARGLRRRFRRRGRGRARTRGRRRGRWSRSCRIVRSYCHLIPPSLRRRA